jgi:hypothetical protein
MAMTPKSSVTTFSGDTDVAGTLAIATSRALYAVAFGIEAEEKSAGTSSAFGGRRRLWYIRLKKIEDEKTGIINRPHGSTYLEKKSVLTSGATPIVLV